ncbi:UNVERIFIED_CONTAM: putative serine/threonine-protein kinase PBL5 [Sesamum latifolium]|uniref:Serine/threonine-protein kinase PBL5 n=1 Tax=Sesamum latifolium TaxID=2727402 RepID=A0AAW2VEG5_9LAMI
MIPANNGYGLAAQLVAVKKTKFDVALTKMELQKQQFEVDVQKSYSDASYVEICAGDKCISFIRQYENEKDWLSRFDHPNIIKMIGYCFNESTHCIVLEYAAGGKLTRHIEDLDWSSTLSIIKKLASAIEYIHSSARGYLHADIKCDNILLMEDNEPKLCDFGTMMEEGRRAELAATFGYLDPEVLRRGEENFIFFYNLYFIE